MVVIMARYCRPIPTNTVAEGEQLKVEYNIGVEGEFERNSTLVPFSAMSNETVTMEYILCT